MTRASQYLTSPNILSWGTAADERLITITFDQIKHIGQPLLLPSTSFCAKDGQGRSARAKPYSVFNSSSSLSCSSSSSFFSSVSSSFCYSSSCDSIITMIMANVCHHQPVTFKQWSDSTSLRCCSILKCTFHQPNISPTNHINLRCTCNVLWLRQFALCKLLLVQIQKCKYKKNYTSGSAIFERDNE